MFWLAWFIPLILLILAGIVAAMSYVKAPTDTAYIITGPYKEPKILIGKAGFRIPFLERVDKISLSIMSIDIKTREAVPTNEFININVDAVANIKVSSQTELLRKAAESLLNKKEEEIRERVIQVLEGNIREIVGSTTIREMVQNRKGIAEKVFDNVVPDMEKLGIELVNFNIQNFSDGNHVIENLGIDNISQISKDAAVAKAKAERDIKIAQSQAEQEANEARIKANLQIVEQNTNYSLKESELKQKSETQRAVADAAYKIEEQKRLEQVNVAAVNANIAKREREVELGNKEVELKQRQLEAEINKKADADKYAVEQSAQAQLFKRQREADAQKFEEVQKAEIQKIQAEAIRVAREKEAEAIKTIAEANKQAALAEAAGIEAKGRAEAQAILAKADAMKQYGEAATLQLILESGVLPDLIKAYSEPMAAAMGQIGSITMYGEGNTAKLNEEITRTGTQIFDGLQKVTGIDLKSILMGYLGGKLSVKSEDKKD